MDTAHSNMKIKQFYLFQLHTKWFNNIETMVTYTQSLSIRNALKIYDIFVYYITDVDLLLQRIIRWWLDLQMGVISNSEVS